MSQYFNTGRNIGFSQNRKRVMFTHKYNDFQERRQENDLCEKSF